MPYGHLREREEKKKKKKGWVLGLFQTMWCGHDIAIQKIITHFCPKDLFRFSSKQPILIEVVLGWKDRLFIEMDYILLSLKLYAFIPSWIQQRPWEREKVAQLCPTLPPHGRQPSSSCQWNSPGENTTVDCHFLLQGIFPTQASNPGLPLCRHFLYSLRGPSLWQKLGWK